MLHLVWELNIIVVLIIKGSNNSLLLSLSKSTPNFNHIGYNSRPVLWTQWVMTCVLSNAWPAWVTTSQYNTWCLSAPERGASRGIIQLLKDYLWLNHALVLIFLIHQLIIIIMRQSTVFKLTAIYWRVSQISFIVLTVLYIIYKNYGLWDIISLTY